MRKEICNRWASVMNTRLKLDIVMTHNILVGAEWLPKETMLRMWWNTLADEVNLPEDWMSTHCEVLVGIQ